MVSHVKTPKAGWSVGESVDTRSHKGRVVPYYMPIPGVRPERDLDCRGIV